MVKAGIDRIREPSVRRLLGGKRIGLVGGASGLNREYLGTIEAMTEVYRVAALYAPEHGSRGVLGPGEAVENGVDKISGIASYSLFRDMIFSTDEGGKNQVYAPQELPIDILVFDMQDVGSRYFTYASTLYYCMQACAVKGIPLCLLDRPNPIGGIVEGNVSRPEMSSFIGLTQVPIRHGMTLGELARLYNGEYQLGCELYVVELDGWKREMFYSDTGLPFVKPSPNLPTMDAITVYNGTCLFAGTNVSEGRGTTTPFTTVGAPYINPVYLAKRMNSLALPGLAFSPAFFRPSFGKHAGSVCYGVDIHVVDQKKVQPVALGVHMMRTIQDMYPQDFIFTPPPSGGRWHIDLASGNTDLRTSQESADQILARWQTEANGFMPLYEKYRIYD
ncbi:MAG: DUF1343 domain-containing protein [Clostridia bacterium]|nr:DUF1343 domain-containing protein [Clostridia bacterium]